MKRVGIDPLEIEEMRRFVEPRIEDTYESLRKIEACDGGIASNMIGLIASAAAEAAQKSADSYLALMVLCEETVKDFQDTEVAAAQTYKGFIAESGDL